MTKPKPKNLKVKGVVTTPYVRRGGVAEVAPSAMVARHIEAGYVEVIHEESQQAADPEQAVLVNEDGTLAVDEEVGDGELHDAGEGDA